MTANIGNLDRLLRVVAGLALLAWAIWGSGDWHMLGWIGVVPLATAAIRFCPLYRILGLSTCPVPAKN